MASNFGITPEKQASNLRFSSQQYLTKPAEVKDVDFADAAAVLDGLDEK